MFLYLLFFLVLFHRAILLSGSPLSPLSLVRDPVYYGHQVAKLVNCSPDLQHLHLLNCLRDRPLEQLLNAQLHVPEFTTAFGPSVDGVIIDVGTAAESSRTNSQSSEKNNSNNILFLWINRVEFQKLNFQYISRKTFSKCYNTIEIKIKSKLNFASTHLYRVLDVINIGTSCIVLYYIYFFENISYKYHKGRTIFDLDDN